MSLFKQSMFFLLLFSALFLVSCGSKTKFIDVTFDSNGATDVYMSLEVDQPFTLPQTPIKEGFTFAGWFLDDETFKIPFTNKYDLTLVKSANLTVFAKWDLKTYTMTFDTLGGSLISPLTFSVFSSSINKPIDPVKEGFMFIDWYQDISLKTPYVFSSLPNEDLTLYAKWLPSFYTLTFNTYGGSLIDSMTQLILKSSLNRPNDPTKEGFTFDGWYLDSDLTIIYAFDRPLHEDTTLHAKWKTKTDDNAHLATDILPVFHSFYGNTDGNLNNMGLAVYDSKRLLHYLSYQTSVYAFDPKTDETTLLFTLPSDARATFLNMDSDILYYINSVDGHLISYHLIDKTFTTISETDNIYASRSQSWVTFIYSTFIYNQDRIAYQRYLTTKQTLTTIEGHGFEPVGISGTRVYYKPVDSLALNVMNYNGAGKSTVVNLESLGVTKQFESLLYHVDNDYVSYFALILEKGTKTGLYLYNSTDGLVHMMDGPFTSLNYDGINIYAIASQNLYKIDVATKSVDIIYSVGSSDTYLNIINNWIYIGSFDGLGLYKINPMTHMIEPLIK